MTRHNLQSHLSWLLNSQHNVPGSATAIPPSASSTIAFGAEPYTLSQFPSQAAESIDSNGDLNSVSNGQCAGKGEEFVRPSLPASALHNTQRLEAMGRLQSGSKSSAKPRLLSQVFPEVVQTPKQSPSSRPSNSLIEQYNAAYNRSDAGNSPCRYAYTSDADINYSALCQQEGSGSPGPGTPNLRHRWLASALSLRQNTLCRPHARHRTAHIFIEHDRAFWGVASAMERRQCEPQGTFAPKV